MYKLLTGVIVTSTFGDAHITQQPIEIVRASDVVLDGYMKDDSGNAFDISGAEIVCTVKRHADDDGYGLIPPGGSLVATIIDGPSGHFQFAIDHGSTDIAPASYVYQISFTQAGTGYRDYPVSLAPFTVTPAVGLPNDPIFSTQADQLYAIGIPRPFIEGYYIGSDDGLTLNWKEQNVGPQGQKGDKGDKGDPGLVWIGDYSDGYTYQPGMAVDSNGSSYIAIATTTGNAPPNATYWDILAAKGDQGPPASGSVLSGGGVTSTLVGQDFQLGSTAGGDATGSVDNLTVVAIQNHSIATTAPTDGYALVWSASNNQWQPGQVATTGSGLQYVTFIANGYFIVDTSVDGVFKAAEAKTLSSITLYRGTAGSSGSTQVDILINGASVFTSSANRPSVLASSGNNAQATVTPDISAISVNDIITMNITAAEDGEPQNVTVELTLN